MTTEDLSKEMLSIISRTFNRINSAKFKSLSDADKEVTKCNRNPMHIMSIYSYEQTLKQDVLSFRGNLAKLRDAFRILTPEKTQTNHIELEKMLQMIVNKYGAFALQFEKGLVQFFNSRFENPNDKRIVEEDIRNFADKLDNLASVCEKIGKKPSELLRLRILEIVEIIDGLVAFSSF